MKLHRYRVLETSFVDNTLVEAGAEVTIDVEVMVPGANMEPLDGGPVVAEGLSLDAAIDAAPELGRRRSRKDD